MKADAILEYFAPLREFLVEANEKLRQQDEVRDVLAKYNDEATIQCHRVQISDWDQTTDLKNQTKQDIHAKAVAERALFTKDQIDKHFRALNPDEFSDERIRRQIKSITNLGSNALNEARLLNLTYTISEMVKIYNTAEFCEYTKPNCADDEHLTLDPGMRKNTRINPL